MKRALPTIDIWRSLSNRDAVCFDVDSTVVTGEFIDELAEYLGVGELVQSVLVSSYFRSQSSLIALKRIL